MATSGFVTVIDNKGIISVPNPSTEEGKYMVSVYNDIDRTSKLVSSPIIYINGATQTPKFHLKVNGTISTVTAITCYKNKPITLTCFINEKPLGVHTVNYEIVSIFDASQLGLVSLTGSFNIEYTATTSIEGILTINMPNTTTFGNPEKVVINLIEQNIIVYSASLEITKAGYVAIATSKYRVIEGNPVTFTINTTNILDNTELSYMISGAPSTAIDVPLEGSVTVLNDTASIVINTAESLQGVPEVILDFPDINFDTNIMTDEDDTAVELILPFPFIFNGIDYGNGLNGGVWLCSNNYITFGESRTNTISSIENMETLNNAVCLDPSDARAIEAYSGGDANGYGFSLFSNPDYNLRVSTRAIEVVFMPNNTLLLKTGIFELSTVNSPGTVMSNVFSTTFTLAPNKIYKISNLNSGIVSTQSSLAVASPSTGIIYLVFKLLDFSASASASATIKIERKSSTPDANISKILTYNDSLNSQKASDFYLSGDTYYGNHLAYIKFNTFEVASTNTIQTHSINIILDFSGSLILPSSKVTVVLTNLNGKATTFDWVAVSNHFNLEQCATELIANINLNSDIHGYKAKTVSNRENKTSIQIFRQDFSYFNKFNVNASIIFPNFYIDTTSICCLVSSTSKFTNGDTVELITPPNIFNNIDYLENPYAGNTGKWTVNYILGNYIILTNFIPVISSITYYTEVYGTLQIV